MMSARVEAAVDAFMRSYLGPQSEHNAETRVGAALEASDAVMFSEAAIERAAKALANLPGNYGWAHESRQGRERYLAEARAVVAALREGA